MASQKPVFFDESGSRRRIVDFVLLALIFIIASATIFFGFYLRQVYTINKSAKTTEGRPSNSTTTILYTETNTASYNILGDQIQNIGNILVPRFLVTPSEVLTPLSYEKFTKSIAAQSANVNVGYDTYFVLSSQNFTQQPAERQFNTAAELALPSLVQAEQMDQLVTSAENSNVSGIYVNIDIGLISNPQQLQQYTYWLKQLQLKLEDKDLHLGLLVDPGAISDVNRPILNTSKLVYFGQSKKSEDLQLEGLARVPDNIDNSIVELTTASRKNDPRENSRSVVNVKYSDVDDDILGKSFDRSVGPIVLRKKPFEYQIYDAVSGYNYIQKLNKLFKNKTISYAVSDPGFEEYTIWDLLGAKRDAGLYTRLLSEEAVSGLAVAEDGAGQILSVGDKSQPGGRKITFDDQSNVIASELDKLSTPTGVKLEGHKPKKIALTFDDGPSPEYTPKIMSILEAHGVKGTFFVVGQNVLSHPETARSIVVRGHEIENHSFSHPVFRLLTPESSRSQIASTNDLITKITGVTPHFFRKPYSDHNKVNDNNDITYLELLKSLNLKASEYDIDSKDWLLQSSDQIVNHVKTQLEASKGDYSQILLHDAHETPELTMQALPKIIEYLQDEGIEITTVAELADQDDSSVYSAPSASFLALTTQHKLLSIFTWASIIFIILSFVRYAWMIVGGVFYTVKRRLLKFLMNNMSLKTETLPRLAVIIACYNEEKVIGKTIEALQNSNYKNFRMILVNDGSTDKTAQIIAKYAKDDSRITLVNVPNGGKSNALMAGMAKTKNRWLVFCDADTLFSKDALHKFAYAATIDGRLGAIAGNIMVGNDNNFLTRSQLIEYGIAHKFIKSSQDITNMITVVPGASGLWKRAVIEKAGGFLPDTLAEDADVTMRIIAGGSRVGYHSNIKAFTEAPEKFDMLYKQRTRWQLGNMQSIFKHRKGLFNYRYGTLGFAGLPLFYLDIIAAVVYPFILTFTLVLALSYGETGFRKLHDIMVNPATDYAVFFGLVLVAIELLLVSFIVVTAQKSFKSKLWLVITIPYFITVYKFFLSIVTSVALIRALKGKSQGWDHLQRTASVKIDS